MIAAVRVPESCVDCCRPFQQNHVVTAGLVQENLNVCCKSSSGRVYRLLQVFFWKAFCLMQVLFRKSILFAAGFVHKSCIVLL